MKLIETGRKWLGTHPTKCELCEHSLEGQEFFVDANLWGTWGLVCLKCFESNGSGLGVGRGQLYRLSDMAELRPMDSAKEVSSKGEKG